MKREGFTLPSGARAELGVGELLGLEGPFGEELRDLRARFSGSDGSPLRLAELPLADLHSLRAILRKLELVPERDLGIRCRNCGHEYRVKPCSTLELAPFRDGELDDPELDAPFDFERLHELPALGKVGLAPLTVGAAAPLHRALFADRPLRVTSAVVRGMGIRELDAETRAPRIARTLGGASDEDFDAFAALFEDAHYPPRLDVPHPCPECGVVEWVGVPLSRELALEPPPGAPAAPAPEPAPEGFPDLDAFEHMVRAAARAEYEAVHVTAVDLSVIEHAADTDEAGEPLLGSYQPPEPDALIPKRAEIRLFYRTFANVWADDGPYDVRAEIAETIRHELEHHLGFLAGDDPLDDDERDQLAREHASRVGRSEVKRRGARALGLELADFVQKTWLLWALVLVATLLALWAQR